MLPFLMATSLAPFMAAAQGFNDQDETEQQKEFSPAALKNAARTLSVRAGSAEAQVMIDALDATIRETGSTLARTKRALITHKYETIDTEDRYYRGPDAGTLLDQTYNAVGAGFGQSHRLDDELDLLTGRRAVRESLQLESIGAPRGDEEGGHVPISMVEPVEVRSHPWQEMLADKDTTTPSPIFKAVPRDHFVTYFSELKTATQLEKALKQLTEATDTFFNSDRYLSASDHIAERLGVSDLKQLSSMAGEAAFVSEDLSFVPGTHYALIVKIPAGAGSVTDYLVSSDTTVTGNIGDYYVISTSQALFDRLEQTNTGSGESMYDAKDFRYMRYALDDRRDGVVYLSEDFITKLVGPRYRIKSARRQAALERLNNLQYTVLAYKSITGEAPDSLTQIAEEGFASEEYMTKISDVYSLADSGIVSHKQWGTLAEPAALSEVELTRITESEKERYDDFRQGYQSFWRQFFDPIGVGFAVGDHLYAHTVILPLLEESQYNQLETAVGGEKITFDALAEPTRRAPVKLFSKINVDQLLFEELESTYQYEKEEGDPPYDELSRQQKEQRINELISQELRQADVLSQGETIDVFGVIGDEALLGVGDELPFELENIADYDIYARLELKDAERAERILNLFYQSVAEEFNGGGGFFRISSDQPVENTYNGMSYYMVPTGFVNLYYIFHDGAFYATISQKAMNNIIDGIQGGTSAELTDVQRRQVDYLGSAHNMLGLADIQGYDQYKKGIVEQVFNRSSYATEDVVEQVHGFIVDYQLLNATDPEQAKKLFNLPESVAGLSLTVKPTEVLISEREVSLRTISFGSRYDRFDVGSGEDPKPEIVEFSELYTEEDKQEFRRALDRIKGAGLALSLEGERLGVKMTMTNPLTDKKDTRFAREDISASDGFGISQTMLLSIAVVVVVFIGLIIILAYLIKQRGEEESEKESAGHSSDTSTANDAKEETSQSGNAPAELVQYIENERARGVADETIRQALKEQGGWSDEEIDAAYSQMSS